MYNFNLRGLFELAIAGMVAIALAVLIGVPLIGWWLFNHVAITW